MTKPWNGLPDQYADKYSRHILIKKTSGANDVYEWCPDDREWSAVGRMTVLKAKNITKDYAYGWPVMIQMTPEEIAQMLKGDRERAALTAQSIGEEWNHTELSPANVGRHIAAAILALPDEEGKKS